MNYMIDFQYASETPLPVSEDDLTLWVNLALETRIPQAELTLRIVDKEEIQALNNQFRKKNKPTNVLAFPANLPAEIVMDYPLLGDVIICPEVLAKESAEQQVPLQHHWAHIVIHGVLHLLGYDHIKDKDAKIMQSLETQLMLQLGYKDPYQVEDGDFE